MHARSCIAQYVYLMPDEPNSEGLLVIRATRRADGAIEARITHGSAGREPSLEISNVASDNDVLALVREWLNTLRS